VCDGDPVAPPFQGPALPNAAPLADSGTARPEGSRRRPERGTATQGLRGLGSPPL